MRVNSFTVNAMYRPPQQASANDAGFEDILQREYKDSNSPAPGTEQEDCHDNSLLVEKIRFYIDDFVFNALIDSKCEDSLAFHNLLAEIERLGLDPGTVAYELYEMGIINEEQRDRLSQGLPI
ncbi:MAG: aldehyde ferredoxin oxidoreductase C-terminal domain-containing protein [Oscillospiraceae bacterium]|nr:aldehyde ferredoxin oxidoreductase C-terminal domain-containing protein [Oscillospiraceae bacterium]